MVMETKNISNMPTVTAIWAAGQHWEIGNSAKETGLPWDSILEDFRHFQRVTKAIRNIVMGKKTLEIITRLSKGKLLPERQIYLLSKELKVSPDERVILVPTPQEVMRLTIGKGQNLAIGGGKGIYETFLPDTDEIILTKVHGIFPADCFMDKNVLNNFTENEDKMTVLRDLSEGTCKVTVHYYARA
jgi:dihydrofolate reductase